MFYYLGIAISNAARRAMEEAACGRYYKLPIDQGKQGHPDDCVCQECLDKEYPSRFKDVKF